MRTRLALFCCLLFLWGGLATAADPGRREELLKLPPNQWVKLHEQKPGDAVRFMRQGHGGSCFDTKRGRLILFGSNTHSKDWTNSPLFYDVLKNEWLRAYPDDPVSSYKVTPEGIPVAGEHGDHPWATHTFGALVYDAQRDEMIVPICDEHMRPDKWGQAVKHLWPSIKKHPTWIYKLESGKWEALPCDPVHFFPNSAAYDSARGVVIGFKPGGIWELGGEPRAWKAIVKKPLLSGWGHDNCEFDAKQKKLVVFGINTDSNVVVAYDPAKGTAEAMPTPGPRPPKDQHAPMAFDAAWGQTVVLADRTIKKDQAPQDTTETWCYDLGKDAWTQVSGATLPFACGMNYTMEYDPHHGILLLVTGGYEGPTAVWGLKLKLEP